MPDISNDWNKVRYELDKSENFQPICNSPWYTDAVYEKFSDEEFARRHAMARAGELAIRAQLAVAARARPGVREYQLAAAAAHAVLDGGGQVHLLMIGSTSMQDPRLIFPNPNPSQRVLREGDIILCELAMTYMGYTAKIGHPVTIGRPTEKYNTFFKEVVVAGFKTIHAQLAPGKPLESVRRAASSVFRQKGAQSRPIVMHGHDLITSLPFVSLDEVKGEPYDRSCSRAWRTASKSRLSALTALSASSFHARSRSPKSGVQALTPYPVDEIIVAG